MSKKRIAVVTTGRADYGLLKPLLTELIKRNAFEIEIIATGTHLSPMHGMTVSNIIDDGFDVNEKIEMTLKSDSENAICNSIGLGVISFSSLYQRRKYDLIVVLGDRYELWAICIPAVIHKIPIAHIHGGELTLGLIDNAVRHSITKMASIHFASIDIYANRIIQMGEDVSKVFSVGALGVDNIANIKLMDIIELSEYSKVDFKKKIGLVTYHPVTLDNYSAAEDQMEIVLSSLLETDLTLLITMSNADTGGYKIMEKVNKFIKNYPGKFILIPNLGQKAYLSSMKYAKVMIGNSSSGIIESASFKLPVVNIGDRQTGRYKPYNVIDCECKREHIINSVNKAISIDFRNNLSDLVNPYFKYGTANRITDILVETDLDNHNLIKKIFFDSHNIMKIQ